MNETIFGFDIGTTSIGFSVISFDEKKSEGQIKCAGSRIFPEGVEKTANGSEPRNKKRRDMRMARRQNRRKKLRRRLIEDLLHENGLLPKFDSREWDALMGKDPWELRVKGMKEPLAQTEAGRVLYHLLKRRGYKSPRLDADDKKEKETGKIKQQIDELSKKMSGQTLAQTLIDEPRRRNRHVGREMVMDEYERLWEAQAKHHPAVLTQQLKNQLEAVAWAQRPVFWRTATLGICNLEPKETLCLKSSWHGQQFIVLQKLNSLRLVSGNGRPLDDDEREAIYDLMMRQKSVSFGGIRKALKKIWEKKDIPLQQKFNFEVGGDTKLPGNAIESELSEIFGKDWAHHPKGDLIRDELADRLRAIYYGEVGRKKIIIRNKEADIQEAKSKFIDHAINKWNATREQAEKLSAINLFPGWLRHSSKAVKRLLPYLEEGCLYSCKDPEHLGAVQSAYPDYQEKFAESIAKLPSHPKSMPELRNPTVNRALNELRKVANNLIAAYGKPDRIRIELARDLRLSGKKLDEANKAQRKREKQREEAKNALIENRIASPNRSDIEKWLLWKEANEHCPYTGKKIGFHEIFGSNVVYQVEHIFPKSRSLDNSYANKTLCHVDINREKNNRSPYEYFGAEKIVEVAKWLEKIGLPPQKIRRFLKEDFLELGDEGFDERQIQDTAYISVEARKFLQRLFGNAPENSRKVETCNGRVTAMLRHYWGMNAILGEDGKKNREDHRHHAVDAIVIAMTTGKFIKNLADAFANERWAKVEHFPFPWPNFRRDAESAVEKIIVSHRVQRKVSGPLHEETSLGDTGTNDQKGLRYYVKRKPVASLTAGEIKGIRDSSIKELIIAHIKKQGLDPENPADVKKALSTPVERISKDGQVIPVNKVRMLIVQQPKLMVLRSQKTKAYADPGENHHMAIYRGTNGKIEYEAVSLFEAARRLSRKESVIRKTSSTGGTLIMSLVSGDMVMFPEAGGKCAYRYVSSVWSAGPIVMHDHNQNRKNVWNRPSPSSLVKCGAKKVSVDPIGRVRPAHD